MALHYSPDLDRTDSPWPWTWTPYVASLLLHIICIRLSDSSQVLRTGSSDIFSITSFRRVTFWLKILQGFCVNLRTKFSLKHSSQVPASISRPTSPLSLSSSHCPFHWHWPFSFSAVPRSPAFDSHTCSHCFPGPSLPNPTLLLILNVSAYIPLL